MIFIFSYSSTAISELGLVSGKAVLSCGLHMKSWTGGVVVEWGQEQGSGWEKACQGRCKLNLFVYIMWFATLWRCKPKHIIILQTVKTGQSTSTHTCSRRVTLSLWMWELGLGRPCCQMPSDNLPGPSSLDEWMDSGCVLQLSNREKTKI